MEICDVSTSLRTGANKFCAGRAPKLHILPLQRQASISRSESSADGPAYVGIEGMRIIEGMLTTIARNVSDVVVVAEVTRRKTPSTKRFSLSTEAGLWAKCGILGKLLGASNGIDLEIEAGVPDETARRVHRLEREAAAEAEASPHSPAGLLLESRGAGCGDDLGDDGGAVVCEVACGEAGSRGLQRDGVAHGERCATNQGRCGVLCGHNVGLHRLIGGIGRISSGHDALVECTLGTNRVVSSNAENDSALLLHRIVASRASSAVVRRQRARNGVPSLESPQVRPSLDDRSDESVADRRVRGDLPSTLAREEIVLQISHDPRAIAGSRAPVRVGAEVNRLHVAGAGVR